MRALSAVAFLAVLVGCAAPSQQACELLDTALDEGQQFAEAWYQRAGPVLAACGAKNALERAERGACAARKFNDNTLECP